MVWCTRLAKLLPMRATASLHKEACLAKVDDLLREAGTSKTNALQATIWLKHIDRDFSAMNAVWNAWVDPDLSPFVQRTRLVARPAILVEVQVTAAVPNHDALSPLCQCRAMIRVFERTEAVRTELPICISSPTSTSHGRASCELLCQLSRRCHVSVSSVSGPGT